MLLDAQFPHEEFEREKEVVIQELKMYQDDPTSVVYDKRSLFFFGDNSYGRPGIGYEETIRSFSREQLFAYKNMFYAKDNLLIAVAGKIEQQQALEDKIAELFSALPEQKTRKKPEFKWQLPSQHSAFFTKGTEQNHYLLTMPGLDSFDERRYAAKILSTALGGNMSSRLFQEIREKLGLCYYIGARHRDDDEYGVFFIRAGLSKEQFVFGTEAIHTLLDQLVKKGLERQEFENAKSYLKGNIQMGIESSDQMTGFLASQRLIYGKILTLEEILARYEAVSLDDVHALLPMLAQEKRWSFHLE